MKKEKQTKEIKKESNKSELKKEVGKKTNEIEMKKENKKQENMVVLEKKEEKKKIETREERIKKRIKRDRRKNFLHDIKLNIILPINAILGIVFGIITFFVTKKWQNSLFVFFAVFILFTLYFIIKAKLKESAIVKKMEAVFPDFLQIMASNLRAGMTIDHSLLLSARKEFAPLDAEVVRLGKDIITGKKIEEALQEMSRRVNSLKIQKTINLLMSGIRAGGNLAVLLENTATNMRERTFVEKRAASNVLMYMIFIFFATALGAPVLFALASVLVEVLSGILSTVPDVSSVKAAISLPISLSKLNIPVNFVIYFSLTFMITINILGSLVLGLVSKGEEKEGMKFIIPLISISIVVFFIIRIFLLNYFADFLSR